MLTSCFDFHGNSQWFYLQNFLFFSEISIKKNYLFFVGQFVIIGTNKNNTHNFIVSPEKKRGKWQTIQNKAPFKWPIKEQDSKFIFGEESWLDFYPLEPVFSSFIVPSEMPTIRANYMGSLQTNYGFVAPQPRSNVALWHRTVLLPTRYTSMSRLIAAYTGHFIGIILAKKKNKAFAHLVLRYRRGGMQ